MPSRVPCIAPATRVAGTTRPSRTSDWSTWWRPRRTSCSEAIHGPDLGRIRSSAPVSPFRQRAADGARKTGRLESASSTTHSFSARLLEDSDEDIGVPRPSAMTFPRGLLLAWIAQPRPAQLLLDSRARPRDQRGEVTRFVIWERYAEFIGDSGEAALQATVRREPAQRLKCSVTSGNSPSPRRLIPAGSLWFRGIVIISGRPARPQPPIRAAWRHGLRGRGRRRRGSHQRRRQHALGFVAGQGDEAPRGGSAPRQQPRDPGVRARGGRDRRPDGVVPYTGVAEIASAARALRKAMDIALHDDEHVVLEALGSSFDELRTAATADARRIAEYGIIHVGLCKTLRPQRATEQTRFATPASRTAEVRCRTFSRPRPVFISTLRMRSWPRIPASKLTQRCGSRAGRWPATRSCTSAARPSSPPGHVHRARRGRGDHVASGGLAMNLQRKWAFRWTPPTLFATPVTLAENRPSFTRTVGFATTFAARSSMDNAAYHSVQVGRGFDLLVDRSGHNAMACSRGNWMTCSGAWPRLLPSNDGRDAGEREDAARATVRREAMV